VMTNLMCAAASLLSVQCNSIGQSIKSPECPCVRPTFLKLSSFHLPLPFFLKKSGGDESNGLVTDNVYCLVKIIQKDERIIASVQFENKPFDFFLPV